MTQTRWYCHACGIEWIFATPECGTGCPNPACHSDHIERITYKTTSPVGDMPRTFDVDVRVPAPQPIEARPALRSLALLETDEDVWAVPV